MVSVPTGRSSGEGLDRTRSDRAGHRREVHQRGETALDILITALLLWGPRPLSSRELGLRRQSSDPRPARPWPARPALTGLRCARRGQAPSRPGSLARAPRRAGAVSAGAEGRGAR